ncbi:hypothetical protein C8R44DRAFT_744373 [Mycena epipterygia]|nr:hypothetical protein C8R44DRAFT_744373 [Mycena epipterygia]
MSRFGTGEMLGIGNRHLARALAVAWTKGGTPGVQMVTGGDGTATDGHPHEERASSSTYVADRNEGSTANQARNNTGGYRSASSSRLVHFWAGLGCLFTAHRDGALFLDLLYFAQRDGVPCLFSVWTLFYFGTVALEQHPSITFASSEVNLQGRQPLGCTLMTVSSEISLTISSSTSSEVELYLWLLHASAKGKTYDSICALVKSRDLYLGRGNLHF